MVNEKIAAAIEKVIDLLRTGNIEKIAYAAFKGDTGRPSDTWSFLNRLIMYCSETEDARGIRQWNRAGRRLKKNTKALYIRIPAMIKTGAKRTNEKGEEEEQRRRVYKNIPVFRLEDTTGAPLEKDNFKLEIPANLLQVADGLGLEIKTKRYAGAEFGYFSNTHKEIALMSPDLKVYLHELSHAVDNITHGRLKNGQQPDQEIVAELSAEVVGYLLGNKLNGKGRDYIEDYSEGSWKPVFALLDRVQKVVAYIVDKAQIEEGRAPSSIPAHVGTSAGVPATA